MRMARLGVEGDWGIVKCINGDDGVAGVDVAGVINVPETLWDGVSLDDMNPIDLPGVPAPIDDDIEGVVGSENLTRDPEPDAGVFSNNDPWLKFDLVGVSGYPTVAGMRPIDDEPDDATWWGADDRVGSTSAVNQTIR
jgi:hypothetical protein